MIGTTFSEYRIAAKLGEGGTGEVYDAEGGNGGSAWESLPPTPWIPRGADGLEIGGIQLTATVVNW